MYDLRYIEKTISYNKGSYETKHVPQTEWHNYTRLLNFHQNNKCFIGLRLLTIMTIQKPQTSQNRFAAHLFRKSCITAHTSRMAGISSSCNKIQLVYKHTIRRKKKLASYFDILTYQPSINQDQTIGYGLIVDDEKYAR